MGINFSRKNLIVHKLADYRIHFYCDTFKQVEISLSNNCTSLHAVHDPAFQQIDAQL